MVWISLYSIPLQKTGNHFQQHPKEDARSGQAWPAYGYLQKSETCRGPAPTLQSHFSKETCMSSSEDDELLGAFIEESVEHLADIEGDLLAIEQGGAVNDKERINKVFRSIHSIKGGAGFVGLHVLQNLAHATENVLGLVRTRKLTPSLNQTRPAAHSNISSRMVRHLNP